MRGYLNSEHATSALLVTALVGLFVLTPLADMSVIHSRLPEYAFWLFLALGVCAITHHPIHRWLGVLMAVGSVVANQFQGYSANLLETICTLVYVFLLLLVFWSRVFVRGRVTAARLVGAVTIYILLGLVFAELFTFIETVHPGSFRFGTEFHGMPTESALMYFSFITLTTVGYGNATPVLPMAHSMSVLEALMGQLYLAILIGRLVASLQRSEED